MARNGSGSYSLPVGNPVVLATTISSTWANGTLTDLAAEMTDSLSRSGKGGMAAPLPLADGTVALPGLTFGLDTNTGIYRIGADNIGVALAGAKVLDIGAVTTSLTGALSVSTTLGVTGAATLSSTAHIVGAITADSTISSKKITATGAADTAGGAFANGTAATAAVRKDALEVTNGDINMDGVANANSNIVTKNRLTPTSLVKAWAVINVDIAGTPTIVDGFNIASVAIVGGGSCEVTLAEALADTNGAPVANAIGVVSWFPTTQATAAGVVTVRAYEASGAGAAITWTDGTARKFALIVMGRQ